MRRSVLTLSLVALANTATALAQQSADGTAIYAGTWEAVTLSSSRDTILVTWRWIQHRDSSGTLTFGDEPVHSGTRIVFASADSVVFELMEPLHFELGHPLDGARQLYVAHVIGDSLAGTVYTRVKDGRQGRRPFAGARVAKAPDD